MPQMIACLLYTSNASLAGAKYGIFKGDQLIDEYYTDENGQFVTQEYIYGSDCCLLYTSLLRLVDGDIFRDQASHPVPTQNNLLTLIRLFLAHNRRNRFCCQLAFLEKLPHTDCLIVEMCIRDRPLPSVFST